jgi:hypothetical protein
MKYRSIIGILDSESTARNPPRMESPQRLVDLIFRCDGLAASTMLFWGGERELSPHPYEEIVPLSHEQDLSALNKLLYWAENKPPSNHPHRQSAIH